jgi:hypothetical protein
MRKKLHLLSAIMLMAVLIVVLNWDQARARESSLCAIAWGRVEVRTACPGDVCHLIGWRAFGNVNRTCNSGGPAPACGAHAWASSGPGWNNGIRSRAWCGGTAKGPFSAYDSILTEATLIQSNPLDTLLLHIHGSLGTIHVNASSEFDLIIYLADADSDTVIEDSLHYAKAVLQGAVLTASGFLSSGDFSINTVGETVTASIDVQKKFTISQDLDSSIVVLTEGDSYAGYCQAPSLTQWGLIILVALLIGSTVFIMLRRRKAVPA